MPEKPSYKRRRRSRPSKRAEADARAAETIARSQKEEAHRDHAALAIRQGLKPWRPLSRLRAAGEDGSEGEGPRPGGRRHQAEEGRSRREVRPGEGPTSSPTQEQRRAKAESLERELEQAEAREKEAKTLAGDVQAALAKAGFKADDDASTLVKTIHGELQTLDAAKKLRAETEAKLKEIDQERAKLDAEVAAAAAQRDVLQARLEELEKKAVAADKALEEAQYALGKLAARDGWTKLLPPPMGKDEADVVESQRSERQRDATAAQSKVATLTHEVQTTEKSLVRAAALAEKRATLDKESALAKTLSDHLKAHELIAWIQEEALARLAEGGSRHLAKLSQNRYALRLGSGPEVTAARAEQDFFVVDAWNGDSIRSVRTLSGGETFLASLALALALAESLTELGAESRATDALESLFLDEGFGTLDTDTLDVVVGALDALDGGDRMVGIVTHVRDLAERLPARLEVGRAGTTATVRTA